MSLAQEITVSQPGPAAPALDVEQGPRDWPEWTDEGWTLGPDADDDGPTDEDLADYREWSAEVDARDHLDHSERLTLAELVDRQQAFYEAWGNAPGRMLAAAMAELALKVRMTDATTPAEYEARIEVLDADIRSDWEARGYDRALEESGERAACLGHFGHPA